MVTGKSKQNRRRNRPHHGTQNINTGITVHRTTDKPDRILTNFIESSKLLQEIHNREESERYEHEARRRAESIILTALFDNQVHIKKIEGMIDTLNDRLSIMEDNIRQINRNKP